jgi:hypothetical protein
LAKIAVAVDMRLKPSADQAPLSVVRVAGAVS